MKIDWAKVKEGITTMDVLKEENKEQKEEIERLNNIINELDNWLEENRYHIEEYDGVLTYLRKLKGSDKE